jgi:hypothetical protein
MLKRSNDSLEIYSRSDKDFFKSHVLNFNHHREPVACWKLSVPVREEAWRHPHWECRLCHFKDWFTLGNRFLRYMKAREWERAVPHHHR